MQSLEPSLHRASHYIGEARGYRGLRDLDAWGGFYLINKARTGRKRPLQANDCPLCAIALRIKDAPKAIGRIHSDGQDYIIAPNSNPIVAGHTMILPMPTDGKFNCLEHRLDLNRADIQLMIKLARAGFAGMDYETFAECDLAPDLPDPTNSAGTFSTPWASYVNPIPGSGRSEPHLHINCVPADHVPMLSGRTMDWQICSSTSGTTISRLADPLFYSMAIENANDESLAESIAELHSAMNEWQQAYNLLVFPFSPGGIRVVVVPRDTEHCDSVDQKLAGLEFLTGVLIPGPHRANCMDTVLRDRAMFQATLKCDQKLRLERLLRGRFGLPSAGSAVVALRGSTFAFRPVIKPNHVFDNGHQPGCTDAPTMYAADVKSRASSANTHLSAEDASSVVPSNGNHHFGQIDSSWWRFPAVPGNNHDFHTQRISANVLVRITRASICQSDRRVLANRKMNSVSGLVLGHEAGGYVVDPGPWSDYLTSGDKVVILPHLSCGECEPCHAYRSNLCRDMVHLGFHLHGNLADLMAFPYQCIVRIDPDFPSDALPLIEPLSCVLRALFRIRAALSRLADASIDATSAGPLFTVFGAGPMGCLAALAVGRIWRGIRVRIVDPNAARRKLACERGIGDEVLDSMPHGEESAISFVASSNLKASMDAIETTEYGGTVVLFSGINIDEQTGETPEYQGKNLELIHRREQSILQEDAFDFKRTRLVGSSGYILDDVKRSIAELRAHYHDHYRRVQNVEICGLKSRTLRYTPPQTGEVKLRCDSVQALMSPSAVDDDLIANTLKVLIKVRDDA